MLLRMGDGTVEEDGEHNFLPAAALLTALECL